MHDRQGEVKNRIGHGEAKELICTTHGHEIREGGWLEGSRYKEEGGKEGKIGTTVVA